MSHTMQYIFINHAAPITLILEPWAEEFDVGAGVTVSIDIVFEGLGNIETEVNEKYFMIWLWAGCRAKIFLDGEDRTPASLSIPAPG